MTKIPLSSEREVMRKNCLIMRTRPKLSSREAMEINRKPK
jgi:hypothetical protein